MKRLKQIRLEAKRVRAVEGVKRDIAEKEEALRWREERIEASTVRQLEKGEKMMAIKGKAVARMEVRRAGDGIGVHCPIFYLGQLCRQPPFAASN